MNALQDGLAFVITTIMVCSNLDGIEVYVFLRSDRVLGREYPSANIVVGDD